MFNVIFNMYFIKKIFPFSFLILSTLILLYVFYKSQIYWNGENNSYYLFYHIISISFFIFSIILFFLKKEAKIYLIIFSISIFSTLYIFEGFLIYNKTIIEKKRTKIKEDIYKKETGKRFDHRTVFEVYTDLKKKDKNVVVGSYPRANLNLGVNNKDFFSLSGVSNANTIYCNENGYMSIDLTDRYGFNNPDKIWDSKNIDFLVIGDSLAQGACVNRPDDIASTLRTISNKNVINLGYGGNGPLIEYATLREYLSPNVKKIFWLYSEWNDLENIEDEKKSLILLKYLQDESFSQKLRSRQEEINKFTLKTIDNELEKKINSNRNYLIIKNFIKLRNARNILNIYLPEKYQPKLQAPKKLQNDFKEIMTLVKKLAEKNNSKLYFVYMPEYNRFLNDYDDSSFFTVKKIIDEIGISFINIHKEVFEKEKNPLILFPFEMPGHYNAEGYKKVSKVLYEISK